MSPMLTSCVPSYAELDIERQANVICTFLLQSDIRYTFFVPYNGGGHWMLIVISPTQDKVVWLDPLTVKVRVDFRRMIALVLRGWKAQTRLEFKRHADGFTKFLIPKKISTQEGNKECGFFVLRYMRDIMRVDVNDLKNIDAYTNEYLVEVINE